MFGRGIGRSGAEAPDPALAELRGYWEGLRTGGDIPLRASVDPRGIAGALDRAFVLERVAPGQARFRIAGMQLMDLMGMEVRGMPIMSFIEPGDRLKFSETLEQVFAGPSVLEARLEAVRGIGRPALSAVLLVLPLRADDGAVTRALGMLATAGDIGRAPRRFALASRAVTPLAPPLPRHEAAFAEPAAPYVPPRAPPGRSHLRLVTFD
jgi:hypothetical protein